MALSVGSVNPWNTVSSNAPTGGNTPQPGYNAGTQSNVTSITVPGNTTRTDTSTPLQVGNYTGGTLASNPTTAAQVNGAYDINSNLYHTELDQVDPQQRQALWGIDGQYNGSITGLTHQRDAAYQNLDTQTHNLNDNYTRNLGQLGNQVRNVLQGQSNALGAQGAGDSSANGMLAYALATQQNQNRGNMQHDLNQQLTAIGTQKDQYDTSFNDQKTQLDNWKQSQYQGIAQQYAQLRQQILASLANNEAARAQALSSAGAWSQAQADAVNRTVNDYSSAITQGYQAAASPNVGFSQITPYAAHNIVTPQLAVNGQLQQRTTPQEVTQAILPAQRRDDQFAF